jgi:hypothetical protein
MPLRAGGRSAKSNTALEWNLMGTPRTPLAKAKATGRIADNPKRFAGRKEPPETRPLGKPSRNLKTKLELEMWEAFKWESCWLMECDRPLVEQACKLRAQSYKRNLDYKEVDQLVRILSRLGMTPVDRSRVLFVEHDKAQSPAESFLN